MGSVSTIETISDTQLSHEIIVSHRTDGNSLVHYAWIQLMIGSNR